MAEQYKFSEKEIEELRKKAASKAEKEAKERQEKVLFEQFLAVERSKMNEDPEDDEVTFTLELAPCQKANLCIDGVKYWDGHEYTVKRKRYNSMMEMIQNGWRHEASLQGKPYNFFQKENPIVVGKTLVTGYKPQINQGAAASKVTTTKTLRESVSGTAAT